jgi:hypothetical protein
VRVDFDSSAASFHVGLEELLPRPVDIYEPNLVQTGKSETADLQFLRGNFLIANGVSYPTINAWVRKYELHGVEGLKESRGWKKYSKELKMLAVEFYLNREGSLEETCKKFDISSRPVLSRSIKRYTVEKR